MCEFLPSGNASYFVYTTKNKVDYKLWGVYQESVGVSRATVCHQQQKIGLMYTVD